MTTDPALPYATPPDHPPAAPSTMPPGQEPRCARCGFSASWCWPRGKPDKGYWRCSNCRFAWIHAAQGVAATLDPTGAEWLSKYSERIL